MAALEAAHKREVIASEREREREEARIEGGEKESAESAKKKERRRETPARASICATDLYS